MDEKIQLRAMGELTHQKRRFADRQLFEATEDEAVELVFASLASVSKYQTTPPQKILDRLVAGALNLDRVGLVSLDEKVLAKFEEKALAFGTRSTIVEGRALEWIKGRIAANKRFLELQSELGQPLFTSNLSTLKNCMETKEKSSERVRLQKKISAEAAETRGLVYSGKRRNLAVAENLSERRSSGEATYLKLPPAWRKFHFQLREFEKSLRRSFLECLETGRILCVDDTASGATLFAPFLWGTTPPRHRESKGLYFVMAKNLPGSWYQKGSVLKGKEREYFVAGLAKTLEANYRANLKTGKKLRKQTFVEQVVEEYTCKPSLARSAWEEAKIPHWKITGRLAANQVLNEVDFTL